MKNNNVADQFIFIAFVKKWKNKRNLAIYKLFVAQNETNICLQQKSGKNTLNKVSAVKLKRN